MLDELKAEVLRVGRLAQDGGLCRQGGGNFSQLDRESGLLVITPHAEARETLEAGDLLVMDLEGRVVENRRGLTPSSETPLHLELYRARADISAVCHTHAKNSAVFATLGLPVKPVLFEAVTYGGYCRVAPFTEPGTRALGRSAVKGMEGTYAVILGHHGLVTAGDDIDNAYLRSLYVEDVCDANLRAAALVGYENVECLSDEFIERYFRGEVGKEPEE